MKLFTKSALTILAASSIASVAVAAPGDSTYGKIAKAEAQIHSLESQLNSKGVAVDVNADTNAAISPSEKVADLNKQVRSLQSQLDAVTAQRSE
ncbi:hypothetical protein [Marinomonas pollencensis]|uniref:Uncharacterized protein n=1 Tax=Marinomonas pollencensis TaxID=491954 RepID=A0A3E0DTN8_9GAMM|nr:hypothetical protein [Marinomonas pollencensis]REG85833.1 hypothetical protein DFP81_102372 [Marinomonas pollencensis]